MRENIACSMTVEFSSPQGKFARVFKYLLPNKTTLSWQAQVPAYKD